MKYTVEFRKEALQDILSIISWYEDHRVGLGDEFFIALEKLKHQLEKNPFQFIKKYKQIRKAAMSRFPYILYYRIEKPRKVIVFAVLHMRRSSKHVKVRTK